MHGFIPLAVFTAGALIAYEVGNYAQIHWNPKVNENKLMQWAEPIAGASFGLAAWLGLVAL